MNEFYCMVNIEPVTFKRPARKTVYDERLKLYMQYKNKLRNCFSIEKRGRDDYPLEGWLSCCFLVGVTKDVGDIDNYFKPIADALQDAGIIRNDKQIRSYLEPSGLIITDSPFVELSVGPYRFSRRYRTYDEVTGERYESAD